MTNELFKKVELIAKIKEIASQGWHSSVKKTTDTRNDGAVGNTLEKLLGIEENNLPLPNASEWELKGQRLHSTSLITLKHIEPSPRVLRIVPNILLPYYGWKHPKAGQKYPSDEMSFRSTTYATGYTSRGFGLILDREGQKLRFVFNAEKANRNEPEIAEWLESLKLRKGIGPLDPEPYWGLNDLEHEIGSKIKNCFYVLAERRIENRHEYFRFVKLYVLSQFNFDSFLDCIESGNVFVDFDARTGHNHGTKFRIKQSAWMNLYQNIQEYKLQECKL